MKLRELARGQDCQVRLENICNFDPATTVLAHVRIQGISGMGHKAPDLLGAWACSSCHSAIDRQTNTDLDRDYLLLCHLIAVARTINILLKREVIKP